MRPHRATQLTILVVEDEWLLREVIGLYLREVGCTVIEAESGKQAVASLQGPERIDAVFTDICLKGPLDGWDVAEAARELRQDIAVVYTRHRRPRPGGRLPAAASCPSRMTRPWCCGPANLSQARAKRSWPGRDCENRSFAADLLSIPEIICRVKNRSGNKTPRGAAACG